MNLLSRCKKWIIWYFKLILTVNIVNGNVSSGNISSPKDLDSLFKHPNFDELSNIQNLGEINFQKDLGSRIEHGNTNFIKNKFEPQVRNNESYFRTQAKKWRGNELHKLSKYWLRKLGTPRELPPSAWCNEQGVVVGIPVTSDAVKMLTGMIESIKGREIPIITEDFLDNFMGQRNLENIYSKGLDIACNGKAFITSSFYEISGKFST
ncbi:C2 domain-containing protein [Cryptosporidium felis]|nr:C2 domain-containing protein [Cryptosporidium felis]